MCSLSSFCTHQVLPNYPGVEHTWVDEGPLGLELRQAGSDVDALAGVVVKDAAPFVPRSVVGQTLHTIAGEDVSVCSYNDILKKLQAAPRPVTMQFSEVQPESKASWVCFTDRYSAPKPYPEEISKKIEAAYESKADVTFTQNFGRSDQHYRVDWSAMQQVSRESDRGIGEGALSEALCAGQYKVRRRSED